MTLISVDTRQMYHGLKWRTEARFYAPMVMSPVGNIFLNDCVQFLSGVVENMCFIKQFLCKVHLLVHA